MTRSMLLACLICLAVWPCTVMGDEAGVAPVPATSQPAADPPLAPATEPAAPVEIPAEGFFPPPKPTVAGTTAKPAPIRAQGNVAKLIANLRAGKKQTIVAYGSRVTASPWPALLQAALAKDFRNLVTVINSGASAATTADGLAKLDKLVLDKNPDAVFLEFAINDALTTAKISTQQSRKNLEAMIDRIAQARPDCQIILLTTHQPLGVHINQRPKVTDYYQVYRDVAKQRKLMIVDTFQSWNMLLLRDKAAYAKYVPDGLHPNAAGCEKVTIPAITACLYAKPEGVD